MNPTIPPHETISIRKSSDPHELRAYCLKRDAVIAAALAKGQELDDYMAISPMVPCDLWFKSRMPRK